MVIMKTETCADGQAAVLLPESEEADDSSAGDASWISSSVAVTRFGLTLFAAAVVGSVVALRTVMVAPDLTRTGHAADTVIQLASWTKQECSCGVAEKRCGEGCAGAADQCSGGQCADVLGSPKQCKPCQVGCPVAWAKCGQGCCPAGKSCCGGKSCVDAVEECTPDEGQGSSGGSSAAPVHSDSGVAPSLKDFLESKRLGVFQDGLSKLGVEAPGDIKFLDKSALKGLEAKGNYVQNQKLEEAVSSFRQTNGDIGSAVADSASASRSVTIEDTDEWKQCMRHLPGRGECGKLDLSNRGLTGGIPDALGKIKGLQKLYLQNNHLTGPIPASMGNMKSAQRIDLSNNDLVGAIPRAFSQNNGPRANCQYLDLSGNRLDEPVTLPAKSNWDQLKGSKSKNLKLEPQKP